MQKCQPNRKMLCGDKRCAVCFRRSFATNEKSKYLSDNNKRSAWELTASSHEKMEFLCPCGHYFTKALNTVTSGGWCPYCTGKFCETDCELCFSKSFASHPSSALWDFTKNTNTPKEISLKSSKRCAFICPECQHTFQDIPAKLSQRPGYCPFCSPKSTKLCGDIGCTGCFSKSFASVGRSEQWSEKNTVPAHAVAKYSNKKYLFDCEKCGHSFESIAGNVTSGTWCPFCSKKRLCDEEACTLCFEASFASHEKSKFWHSKNTTSARQTFKFSEKIAWFACGDCSKIFEADVVGVSKGGRWCFHCSGKERCIDDDCGKCFLLSFASSERASNWSQNNKNKKGEVVTPRQVSRGSNKKYLFVCDECGHEFSTSPALIKTGAWCFYCRGRNLCEDSSCAVCFSRSFASSERAKYCLVEKSKYNPRQLSQWSSKKLTFLCEKSHEFETTVAYVTDGHWCEKCRYKTQDKVLKFLLGSFASVQFQFRPSWAINPETNRQLSYDYLIGRTIIELDGDQHYVQVLNWDSPEQQQKRDKLKEGMALEKGYSVVRILQRDCCRRRKIDWKSLLLENIKDYETPIVKRLWDEGSTPK
ncbi:hypothetical protein GMAR_ORF256 [Golden Marseillevirus]|uniref:hypothetical protein n=1 Tax=Golden Marseillevirus TaxID=1720526 RepID=UPI000877AA0A|nr:hypothetical protein GMAR_ORF256 [Golden Marseillevirus]ALX27630.1 hypothetical protein GMAR_ORF256 [Golden Marseillevirus]